MEKLRIGLDIDNCLADFWGAYCEYFDTAHNPRMLIDEVITKNVQQILSKDRDFWLGLKVINMPDFIPELYCTKRVNSKAWTKKWLEMNGFPIRPIYQMYYQQGNKADMIKGKVDVFVDDSFSNVIKCQKSGLPALLYHTERTVDNPMFKVFSITRDEITEAYNFLKTYGEGIF